MTMTTYYCDIIGNLGGCPYDLQLQSPPSEDTKKQASTIMELIMFFYRVQKYPLKSMHIVRMLYEYVEALCAIENPSKNTLYTSPKMCATLQQKATDFSVEFLTNRIHLPDHRDYFLHKLLPQMNRTIHLLKNIQHI